MPHQELKPYVLVRIQANDYAYIGQLIGFPLPDQTIMVRRVPGHPGTLFLETAARFRPSPEASS